MVASCLMPIVCCRVSLCSAGLGSSAGCLLCSALICVLLRSHLACLCCACLCCCRKFELPGADKALRGMWPLVFSKHEPVRQSVLDSWHILHLHNRTPKQQVSPCNNSDWRMQSLHDIITARVA